MLNWTQQKQSHEHDHSGERCRACQASQQSALTSRPRLVSASPSFFDSPWFPVCNSIEKVFVAPPPFVRDDERAHVRRRQSLGPATSLTRPRHGQCGLRKHIRKMGGPLGVDIHATRQSHVRGQTKLGVGGRARRVGKARHTDTIRDGILRRKNRARGRKTTIGRYTHTKQTHEAHL